MQPEGVDRRIIYLLVLVALSVPLLSHYRVRPARMRSAERVFEVIDGLKVEGPEIAFVALDIGPSTKAENEPQAEVLIEHLMRKRVPLALFSIYYQAEPFLVSIPERVAQRLMKEMPGSRWEYGKDWVNLGYRAGSSALLQGIPKSSNLAELFASDARGTRLSAIPLFSGVRTLDQIKVLVEITGLYGALEGYLQFFQKEGYRPLFVHGCTSIVIPTAFIYLDSEQLAGLLEGIAGAAWYSGLLAQRYPQRVEDSSGMINTALGIAHLVLILLIVAGNGAALWGRYRKRE
jgi:hypothetical protein